MIKACIFDLDGTILDTVNTIAYYCNKALAKFGLDIIEVDEFKYLAGDGARKLVERMLDRVGADKEVYFDKVYKYYTNEYDKDVTYLTKPFDGIPELLSELKMKGITTCVLSNKPDFAAVEAVKRFLGDLIDVTHGGRDSIALKPSPDGVSLLLEEIGCSAGECVYVGDTSTDMQTGKNSGLYTLGVLWGFRDRAELETSGADVIVSTVAELAECIKSINI